MHVFPLCYGMWIQCFRSVWLHSNHRLYPGNERPAFTFFHSIASLRFYFITTTEMKPGHISCISMFHPFCVGFYIWYHTSPENINFEMSVFSSMYTFDFLKFTWLLATYVYFCSCYSILWSTCLFWYKYHAIVIIIIIIILQQFCGIDIKIKSCYI